MVVTGTGVVGTVTVSTVTEQNNIVLSSAQSVSDNVVITFSAPDAVTTTHILDSISGTIAAGMDVTGTGVPSGVTVSAFSGSTVTLSEAVTLADNIALTFSEVYTIAAGGVNFNDTNNTADLTLSASLLASPSNGDSLEFLTTNSNYLSIIHI